MAGSFRFVSVTTALSAQSDAVQAAALALRSETRQGPGRIREVRGVQNLDTGVVLTVEGRHRVGATGILRISG